MRSFPAHFSSFTLCDRSFCGPTSEAFILFLAKVLISAVAKSTVDEKLDNPFSNVRLVNQVVCLLAFRFSYLVISYLVSWFSQTGKLCCFFNDLRNRSCIAISVH